MDDEHKKTALRMIPYGIYVLTAVDGDTVAAATVNWVTQTSFDPPLVVVGVKGGIRNAHRRALPERWRRISGPRSSFISKWLNMSKMQLKHEFL